MNILLKLPILKRRERKIEYRLRDELDDEYGIMFVKLKPTVEGIPDRMAIGFRGAMRFVELKTDDGDLSETQKLVHAELARRGQEVIVLRGKDVKWMAECVDLALRMMRR